MVDTSADVTADSTVREDLAVNPPKQERSRAAWERVLDAGVHILEENGYEGFTIAAVCDRAGVSVPSIYARTKSKEALFVAVYEHALAEIRLEETVFEKYEDWSGLSARELIAGAVEATCARFIAHADFFRTVILRSTVNQAIQDRGAVYSSGLSEKFSTLVLTKRDEFAHENPEAAVDASFRVVFSSLVVHIAYGPHFMSNRSVSNEQLVRNLQDVTIRYLLGSSLAI